MRSETVVREAIQAYIVRLRGKDNGTAYGVVAALQWTLNDPDFPVVPIDKAIAAWRKRTNQTSDLRKP